MTQRFIFSYRIENILSLYFVRYRINVHIYLYIQVHKYFLRVNVVIILLPPTTVNSDIFIYVLKVAQLNCRNIEQYTA